MAKTLLQIDAAIAILRQQIKNGVANKQISLIQMADLLDQRAKIVKADAAQNQPTKDF